MKGLTVYSKEGMSKDIILRTYQYVGQFMGDRKIQCSLRSPHKIDFAIGDYVMFRGMKYKLYTIPSAKKQSRRNEYGASIVYDDVVFMSEMHDLSVIMMYDYVIGDNKRHYSGLGNFAFYTDKMQDLGDRILANIERVYGKDKWQILYACYENVVNEYGDVIVRKKEPEFKPQSISINDNTSVLDALNMYKNLFDINYIYIKIGGINTIVVGGEALLWNTDFAYGKNRGLLSLQQSRNESDKLITRLNAYGTNRNMPYRYYNNKYRIKELYPKFFNGDEYILESMYINKLMMPYEQWVNNGSVVDSYIESENIEKYGLREGDVTFDGSDSKWNEIYPSLEGMTKDDLKPGMIGFRTSNGGRLEPHSYGDLCIGVGGAIHHDMGNILFQVVYNESDIDFNFLIDIMKGSKEQVFHDKWGNTWNGFDFPQEIYEESLNDIKLLLYIENKKKSIMATWYDEFNFGLPFNIDQSDIDHIIVYDDDDKRIDRIVFGSDYGDGNLRDNGISSDGNYPSGTETINTIKDTDGAVMNAVFYVYIAQCLFNPKDFVGTDTPMLVMKTGMCSGREFEILDVTENGSYNGGWRLKCKRDSSSIESMNMLFPNTTFIISAGDEFVFTGINMPEIYVDVAEQRLLKQAERYLAEHDKEKFNYSIDVDNMYLANHPTLSEKITEGMMFPFNDTDKDDLPGSIGDLDTGSQEIHISQLTIKVNEGYIPKYEIQLEENVSIKTLGDVIDGKVRSAVVKNKK